MMGKNQINKQVRNSFLKHLSPEEKEQFLSELVEATIGGDPIAASDCLEAWREVSDLNRIPGFKARVWERFNALKESGKVC